MSGIFRRRPPPQDSGNRLIIELPRNGNLDQVLRLFIDTVGDGLHAIALALSTKEDNSTQILELASKVKAMREKLQTSLDNQTKGD